MYGEGVSKVGEILDLGVKAGLVEKSGAWFSYDSIRIGQGRENAKVYLKENPDVAQRIENAIRGRTEEVGEALMVGPARGRRGRRRVSLERAAEGCLDRDPLAEVLRHAWLELLGRTDAIGANSRFGSVRTMSRKPPAAHSAVPIRNGSTVPSNAWPMTKPIERRADGADDALDRGGRAGDRRHMLHRQRAEVGRGEGEAAHRQALQHDEQPQGVSWPGKRDRRMERRDDRERQRRAMADTAQPEAADEARIEPGRQRHRRGDRGEDQADEAARVEGIEDDLLDRGDVGDQRRRS